ncbi:(2Fe-2S)-binding protein [Tabrizicola sp.]|uniref:(2Fe-2S)-binding protein n=1 Tax=Tabrizicola sp. TaxID=2005166 RepID=UPI003F2E22B5
MAISFTLNGAPVTVDVDPEMPVLWVVRETLGLTGTKFGCGIAACGACTMHVDGVATRTCVLPVGDVAGLELRTIEGIATGATASAVQRAWIDLQVPQCGYCQSGMIMAVEALLDETPDPSDGDIDAAITNICRCGTQERIRAGVHLAARLRREA